MLFLFREEALPNFRKGIDLLPDRFYEFFPWNYGPFSRDIYDDLEFFTLRGFIERGTSNEETLPESAAEWTKWLRLTEADLDANSMSEYMEQEFRLTQDRGVPFAAALYKLLNSEQRKLLREFKARTSRIHLRALLEYVYRNYERMTTRSVIRKDILGDDGDDEE